MSPSPPACSTCGTAGDDFIEVGPGDLADGSESIDGGEGNDTIVVAFVDAGLPWEMVVRAGEGDDVVVISIEGLTNSNGEITVRTGMGQDSVVIDSWAPTDIASGDGDDAITCGWGSDQASAGPGQDSVACRSGSDLVAGGRGSDILRGGRGADLLTGGRATDVCFATRLDVVSSCRRAAP